MKVKCDYCGQMISDAEPICPHCGAANSKMQRAAYGVPKTIQELKDYCISHNLPLRDMRVFIGEDYRGAKAFGIYKDEASGHFIVYKNKADGSRAIRYEGNDEAYAVNELYLKIKERVAEQKKHQAPKIYNSPNNNRRGKNVGSRLARHMVWYIASICIIYLIAGVFLIVGAHRDYDSPSTGYYSYEDSTYYYYRSDWYRWNDYNNSWSKTYDVDDVLEDNYEDYYESYGWDDSYEAGDFKDSGYYSTSSYSDDDSWSSSSWDDDWDDDYDWDDSWDDWDSDW